MAGRNLSTGRTGLEVWGWKSTCQGRSLCQARAHSYPHCHLSLSVSLSAKEGRRCPPAHQPEPGEAVIEGVSAGHHVVTVLNDTGGHLCSAVVHLPHQVQALPAGTAGVNVDPGPALSSRHYTPLSPGDNELSPAPATTSSSGSSRFRGLARQTSL